MKKKLLIATSIMTGLLVIVAAGAFLLYNYLNLSTTTEKNIYIYPGATTETVTDSISAAFGEEVAAHAKTVLEYVEPDWSKRVGMYKIANGTNVWRLAKRLEIGSQTPIRFTFSSVRTVEQLAERVGEKFLISKDDFLKEVLSDYTYQKTGTNRETVGAIFFPDTYDFYWTASAESIVDRFYSYYKSFWNDERNAKAGKLGLSPLQVSTLASIVEEETNNRAERSVVARLYLNRIHKGMLLQADPTVKFALGDFVRHRITSADLEIESPYNTYKFAGLPPGPIRLPEKATIDAALNSKPNNYLYMCAKWDFSGKHLFTASYGEHLNNARRYHAALNARGIKR